MSGDGKKKNREKEEDNLSITRERFNPETDPDANRHPRAVYRTDVHGIGEMPLNKSRIAKRSAISRLSRVDSSSEFVQLHHVGRKYPKIAPRPRLFDFPFRDRIRPL